MSSWDTNRYSWDEAMETSHCLSTKPAPSQDLDWAALQYQVLSTAFCQVLPLDVLLLTGSCFQQGHQQPSDGRSWTCQGPLGLPCFCTACPLDVEAFPSPHFPFPPPPHLGKHSPFVTPVPAFSHCSCSACSCSALSDPGVSCSPPSSNHLSNYVSQFVSLQGKQSQTLHRFWQKQRVMCPNTLKIYLPTFWHLIVHSSFQIYPRPY